jgi:hypothetical protein
MKSLDEVMPVYEFSERHRVSIDASPERIDRALRELTFADLPLVRALFRLRGRRLRGGVVPAITQIARVLEDVPGEGLVFILRGQFWRFRGWPADDGGPGAEALGDLRVVPGGLTTETRVHVGDPTARRKFRRYWLLIRPFSGLIRILILRAAKRRAEAA